jgi:hypothetical protein
MNVRVIRRLTCRLAGLMVALAASLGVARSAEPPSVARLYFVVVPPAQNVAFSEGIRTWEQCLRDHGGKQRFVTYAAETGNLDRYLFLEQYGAWSGMDNHDPGEKACAPTFRSEVLPHFDQGFSEIAQLDSKATYMPGGDPDPAAMMWIDAFRIKPGQTDAFDGALAKFTAAAAKTHWPGHFAGYDIAASGQGAESFLLVWPNKSWADIGRDPSPSVKRLMANVYGKAAARANHERFIASVAEEWSDVWSYDKNLSYTPDK